MFVIRWRLLLACLMLVVIPLQGLAAAFRVDCHAGAAFATKAVQRAQPVSADHDHAGNHASNHSAVVADSTHHTASKASQCNACSPCCASALVGQPVVLAVPDLVAPATFFLPDTRHPSAPIAGLDRPPRNDSF